MNTLQRDINALLNDMAYEHPRYEIISDFFEMSAIAIRNAVYPDAPYWDSHCLNKDVATIADNPKAYLLRQIINFNNHCKKSL